jgi:hypothetical protein
MSTFLENTPLHGFVGSYGGGNAIQFAHIFYQHSLPTEDLPNALKTLILSFVEKGFQQYGFNEIFKFPKTLPQHFSWNFNFQITQSLSNVEHMNFWFQGLLFEQYLLESPEVTFFISFWGSVFCLFALLTFYQKVFVNEQYYVGVTYQVKQKKQIRIVAIVCLNCFFKFFIHLNKSCKNFSTFLCIEAFCRVKSKKIFANVSVSLIIRNSETKCVQ